MGDSRDGKGGGERRRKGDWKGGGGGGEARVHQYYCTILQSIIM